MRNGGIVYLLCSPNRGTVYTGVTSDLQRRTWEHKTKFYENSFTKRYNCVVLVWYKYYDDIVEAIKEEKRIKAGSRESKDKLINSMNYDWKDLWDEVEDLRLY
jgi:putative endonuclease